MTGFDLWLSVLTLGIVCTIYTALVTSLREGWRGGRWGKEERWDKISRWVVDKNMGEEMGVVKRDGIMLGDGM